MPLWYARLSEGLYDYHPDAIPAPYNHSNIDSDEVLYYVDQRLRAQTRNLGDDHPAPEWHSSWPSSQGARKKTSGRETKELAGDGGYLPPTDAIKQAGDRKRTIS